MKSNHADVLCATSISPHLSDITLITTSIVLDAGRDFTGKERKMSKCFGCYSYTATYMWNSCDYFECEYFIEPDDCLAFSIDGNIPAENEALLYEQTGGVFGKPLEQEKTE